MESVCTSLDSWEVVAASAVEAVSKSLRGIRIAEVLQMDITVKDSKAAQYHTKVKLSFKYEGA